MTFATLLLVGCAGSPPPKQPEIVYQTPVIPQAQRSTDDILFRALGLVGTPYRYGGNTPDSGFDCSGLIGYVYRDVMGIVLPRSTGDMINLRAPSVSQSALQTGDLVFFATGGGRRVSHAGIYVGEGRFVHAPSSGGTVRLDYLSNTYWQKSYLAAKRVVDDRSLARSP
ncbi:lipoprotein [Pseudomonas matsuisoli]|uniref:Lipoprotein n=2 Tax=Pseudomonas matsuisoli TaxID=1515666 RepID=A0A917PTF9_9PSED|nr:C40 family peptidase [Pseudomonas matsuisoli]GGJ91397.1 lipoprotein [Pseudomonas matsuisoli]